MFGPLNVKFVIPAIPVIFYENSNFLDRFSNILKSDLMKIRPVGAKLFDSDGRTNGQDEANNHTSQFLENA